MQLKVKGIPQATAFLKTQNLLKLKEANEGIHKAGFFVEGEVKASIAGQRAEPRSVDTGRFLNSVQTDNLKPLQSVVKSDVEYAPDLEFGTTRINPRHHFKNTEVRTKTKVQEIVQRSIN